MNKRTLFALSFAVSTMLTCRPAPAQTIPGSNQSAQVSLTNAVEQLVLPNCTPTIGAPLLLKIHNTGEAPLRYSWTPTNGIWHLLEPGGRDIWGPVGVPDGELYARKATSTNTTVEARRELKRK